MLSVIIPLSNDKTALERSLPSVRKQLPDAEIVVVDGGSSDGGPEWVAAQQGVKLVRSAVTQRAFQMNLGAEEAQGDDLLFLHADTQLTPGAVADLQSALSDRRVEAGAFRFLLDGNRPFYRLIEQMVRLRNRLFLLPYGDQGLFIRRALFERIDGFPQQPLMEDVAIIDRLKQETELYLFPGGAITSARRWEQGGSVKTTLMNWLLLLAYRCGVSPSRLAAWRSS